MTTRAFRAASALEPVAVVGPGALGSALAARFALSRRRVMLVGRAESWLRRLRARGLRFEGPAFGRRRRLGARRLGACVRPAGPVCSALFFCVKSEDTAAAARGARRLVGPRTAVVGLQNGLAHRAALRRAFGRPRTVFGVSFVAANRPDAASVRHAGGNALVLGLAPGNSAAARRAREILSRAGWSVRVESSEERLLWTKAAFNAASNPLGALAARANGELVAVPALREIAFRALGEASAAARAAGHPLLYRDLRPLLARGLAAAPGQPNSMLQDLRAGRRTEADAIVGPFLRAARARGVPVPTLEALHRFVRRLERELAP